jgi:acetylornithine deacetylase/succinyl-diaminopimelate desuccinylase-like protein
LEEGGASYIVDEYLSSDEALRRVPTRYDSDIVCFLARGRDPSQSVTFLVNIRGPSNLTHAMAKGEIGRDKSCLNLAAGNLVSAFVAIRKLTQEEKGGLPLDVAFILLGGESRKWGYRGLATSVSEAFASKNHGMIAATHLVVVEPTDLKVCNVQKGCITFKLVFEGQLHHPSFSWLGRNALDAVNRFSDGMSDIVRPQHDKYPVEVGKTTPLILSRFLVGLPTMIPTCVRCEQKGTVSGSSRIEVDYYVSTPPEFSSKSFKDKLNKALIHVAETTGCRASIEDMFEEEPFRENPHSIIVTATSDVLKRLTEFEPTFEWLPFPISAAELKSNGFARDVIAFGPGDPTLSAKQDEKNMVRETLLASEVLAKIPQRVATLEGEHK